MVIRHPFAMQHNGNERLNSMHVLLLQTKSNHFAVRMDSIEKWMRITTWQPIPMHTKYTSQLKCTWFRFIWFYLLLVRLVARAYLSIYCGHMRCGVFLLLLVLRFCHIFLKKSIFIVGFCAFIALLVSLLVPPWIVQIFFIVFRIYSGLKLSNWHKLKMHTLELNKRIHKATICVLNATSNPNWPI